MSVYNPLPPSFEAMVAMQALTNLGYHVGAVQYDPDAFQEAREVFDECCMVDDAGSIIIPPEFENEKHWNTTCHVLAAKEMPRRLWQRILYLFSTGGRSR